MLIFAKKKFLYGQSADQYAGGNDHRDENTIVGIDLGTTNSLVAYMDQGLPTTIKNEKNNQSLVPSIIHIEGNQVWVGEEAKNKLLTDPEHTVYSVKRLMGKSQSDMQALHPYFSYDLKSDEPDALVRIRIGGRFFTPVELSAEILKQLKHLAENHLKKNVTQAVITVPAYFNDAQRQATRDAGRLAGLDVLRIINEPTAASMAYGIGMDVGKQEIVAVYDLGGGTFDISILHIQDGVFEVLSTHGDTFLGGDDMDKLIFDHWLNIYNIPSLSKTETQELRLIAESCKKHLSNHSLFEIEWRSYILSLHRTQFDELINPILDKTLVSCKQALKDAGLATDKIEKVILVGGSTRVPCIKNGVKSLFGDKLYDKLNPDEVVALGAAIQANILAGNDHRLLLLDVTPLSLGIETMGGLMDTIIARNSKVPCRAGRQYTTSLDGQRNLKISVFQGERDLVINNRKLGEFILKGIPPMPAGMPKIEIQFHINADGILSVRAKELRSGVETEVEVKSPYGLSEEEMSRMLLDSIKYANQDMQAKALQEATNEGKHILISTKRFLSQNEALLTENEKMQIEKLSSALNQALDSQQKDQILASIETLNLFSAPIAHRMMDIHIGSALQGQKPTL